MQRHHVQVAFAQDDVGAFRFLRQIQPVQHPPFTERHRLGGIHVLWRGIVDHAAAEAHHVAPAVDDRQHQTVAELVVNAAVFPGCRQSRRQQLLLGVALGAHGARQRIPLVQRRAHTEADGDIFPYLPAIQIGLHRRTLRLL